MKRTRAFTLTETVLSVALLALVWLAAAELILISKISGSFAKHKMQAVYVAQRAMEELHRKPFDQVAGSTVNVSIDTRGTPDDYADDLMGVQQITVTTMSAYYKKALIEVRWDEHLHLTTRQMKESLASFITNDPQTN